jgi:hypothetical protein
LQLRSSIPRKVVEVFENALLIELLTERQLLRTGVKRDFIDRLFHFQSRKSFGPPVAVCGQMPQMEELNSLIARCQLSKTVLEVMV